MSWRDLLSKEEGELLVLPWIGGRSLRLRDRVWTLEGPLPDEHGWCRFVCSTSRKAYYSGPGERNDALALFDSDERSFIHAGYLVGDRFFPTYTNANPHVDSVHKAPQVHLIEPGLDRFVRVHVASWYEESPLVYIERGFPLGPESDVLEAFLDGKQSIDHIKGVVPALDAAFRMEVRQREEAERRRQEIERRLREEEEKRAAEEQRKKLFGQLGTGEGRRAMAHVDFGQAARSALAVGGAVYLDHRKAARNHEIAVRFRYQNRRFECTCHEHTLQIIDSGICLTAHDYDDGFGPGIKGDTLFTLESLPAVINEAIKGNKLVVYRHVD